jgi:hypothetical protein
MFGFTICNAGGERKLEAFSVSAIAVTLPAVPIETAWLV